MKRLFTPEWVFPAPVEIPEPLRREIGGSELFLQMLVRRGFTDPAKARTFLDPDSYTPCPAGELPGIDRALPRILQAIDHHEKIGIWGDFDVDGQTSTAVLLAGLRRLGCDVCYHVPVRGPESHGISLPFLEKFLQTGVQLLITCDTGISANDAVALAQENGVDTIITDHHTLPETLPQALALIDPQFLPEGHPLGTLSGVGVAYKVIEALYADLDSSGEEEPLLDLVALGLIADIAILTGDARYLVQRGLQQIRNSPRLCLATIFKENKVNPQDVNEGVISFLVAPRLNAVGRLGDANPIVEFLLTDDPVFSATTYNLIEGLNSDRKIKCDQVFKSAQSMIESEPRLLEKPLLYLGHPEWPTGVVGIVASRLVELYHRPAILFNTSDAKVARGSARSVDGINITAAIASHKDMLDSFGGHPMAAGCSVPVTNFDALKYKLYQTIGQIAEASDYHPTVEVDMQVELKDINLDLVDELQKFAPFGPGNPPILFAADDLEIESVTPMGRTKEHESLILSDSVGNPHKVVWWQSSELPHPSSRFDLAFSAALSIYKGKTELQLEWQEYRECESDLTAPAGKAGKSTIEHVDMRNSSDPIRELMSVAGKPGTIVFAEGYPASPVTSSSRSNLHPAAELVLWTIPPSIQILQSIIQTVDPKKIYWAAATPEENDLPILLKKVGRLLKSSKDGKVIFTEVAEKAVTTKEIIRQVVLWYTARGDITLLQSDTDSACYSLVSHPGNNAEVVNLQYLIQTLHNEVIAFREYYRKVASPALLLPEDPKRSKRSRN